MVFSPTPNQGSVSLMFKPGYALIENIQVLIKISLSFSLMAGWWMNKGNLNWDTLYLVEANPLQLYSVDIAIYE